MSLYVDVSHVSVYQCNVMQRILTMSYVIMYACMSKQHASLWGATRQEKNSNYSRVLQFGDRTVPVSLTPDLSLTDRCTQSARRSSAHVSSSGRVQRPK